MFILSILHRDNVSLQTNIFFEPYLDDIAPCMTALYSTLDFVNSRG